MPRGTCNYPEHHSPSAGPPFALLGAIALGAVIIAAWHAIVVALVVVAILACVAGAVFLLIHNHRSGYDPELERQSAAERAGELAQAERRRITVPADDDTALLRGRVEYLEQLAAQQQRRAVEAAPVHNHLHLHGVSDNDMAAVARKAIEPPANSW